MVDDAKKRFFNVQPNVKMEESVLERKSPFKILGCLSLLNCIGTLALSLLLKLLPRKLEPWFILWCFFLLRLLCISVNLSYGHAWNTVVMSGLFLLVATWNCWISYKNGYAWLLVLHLLPLLNHWLIVGVYPGCICQQFLSSHSETLEFSAYRMLYFDVWTKCL